MKSLQIAASVPNLRDLGGLATASGRILASGRLFRSSHFGALAASDEAAVRALGLRTVVDLRGVQERAGAPNQLAVVAAPAWQDLHVPIEPSALTAMSQLREAGQGDEAAMLQVMHGAYSRFVRRYTTVYAALLQHLLRPESYPLVFHCTAGKDRTGFGAALVLLALQVPREAIVDDFLLSNTRWLPQGEMNDWTVLSRVRADYLHTAFAAIDEGWGSTEAYFDQALAFDAAARARLADLLLIDP